MIFQECSQIFQAGVADHLLNPFNLLDFLLLSVYTSVFTVRYWTMIKVSGQPAWSLLRLPSGWLLVFVMVVVMVVLLLLLLLFFFFFFFVVVVVDIFVTVATALVILLQLLLLLLFLWLSQTKQNICGSPDLRSCTTTTSVP